MDELFEIFKLIVPGAAAFFTSFYILKQFFQNEHRKRMAEIKQTSLSQLTPVKLQAYERLALFLERAAPDNLLLRVHKQGMSSRQLQAELIKTIRSEFDHNLSQQIYISNTAWSLVKRAKEEMIKLVNLAAAKVNDDASGIDLSRHILELASEVDKTPTTVALDYLKKEMRQSF